MYLLFSSSEGQSNLLSDDKKEHHICRHYLFILGLMM